jgi:DNA-binding transcriptional ArsR family regulator
VASGQEPFQIALQALRQQLRQGVHPPGSGLSIIELARALKLSHTPVREVLARLAGEGLIEDRRGKGYFVWQLAGGDLIDLYEAHAFHLRLALEAVSARAGPTQAQHTLDPEAIDRFGKPFRAELIFDQIVMELGNRYVLGQQRRLAERLSPLRLAEARVLRDVDAELDAVMSSYRDGDWARLAACVAAYHERRRAQAGVIAAVADGPASAQPRI